MYTCVMMCIHVHVYPILCIYLWLMLIGEILYHEFCMKANGVTSTTFCSTCFQLSSAMLTNHDIKYYLGLENDSFSKLIGPSILSQLFIAYIIRKQNIYDKPAAASIAMTWMEDHMSCWSHGIDTDNGDIA